MSAPEKEEATSIIANLQAEKGKLEAENARLKNLAYWINKFLVLLLVGATLFVCWPVSNILSNDIKDASLAWVYGIKVFGSIAVLCALLLALLALVRSDPDQRD